MYEENRRFSWTNLFIKIIIVIIFILFTIWLLSLSTRGMSNKIDVLTDSVFSDNIDRMKEVGKSYFTTERLPKEVGDVKILSLQKMYDQHLLLEVRDKYGKACSADNSYVSIEKLEKEYQMKVYLECGNERDYIKVIMGCYNYCDTDICEKDEKEEKPIEKALEYEYSRSTAGAWGPWGAWTNWSTNAVTKTNSREVDSKIINETYTYDKAVTQAKYIGDVTCDAKIGDYKLVSNSNGVCKYSKGATSTQEPTCPTISGYTNTGVNETTCSYKANTPDTTSPQCKDLSGWSKTRSGFTCTYKKSTTTYANPSCKDLSGWSKTISGFTCTYKKSTTTYANPSCKDLSGWSKTRSGFTCKYTRSYKEAVGVKVISSCDGCTTEVQTVYETKYETKTGNKATCPTGYKPTGNTCYKTTTTTDTATATCPQGYSRSGDSCVKYATKTASVVCDTANGYELSGNSCVKSTTKTMTKDAVCAVGYNKNNKCYKDETTYVEETGTKSVTYYRYRTRNYSGGSTDYKWSISNNDKNLLDAGYKLTGKTREIVGGK